MAKPNSGRKIGNGHPKPKPKKKPTPGRSGHNVIKRRNKK